MKNIIRVSVAALAVVGISGAIMAQNQSESLARQSFPGIQATDESKFLAQAPSVGQENSATTVDAAAPAVEDNSLVTTATESPDANEAPEITKVSGQLLQSDGTPSAGGVLFFVFQNRLNEVPHTNPLDKIKAMSEVAVPVDTEGSFTLRMKPGNFAIVYDPTATEAPTEPGPESMAVLKRVSKEQVQARIAAIKENAAKGLPIVNGKLGDAFIIENRYVRPPVSNFGEIQLQSNAVVTIKAVDEAGELIGFPATLRLRGKNGDIMDPHTPSVSTRALYTFHDLMPQSYQVFALGSLPRPGGGDKVTTPTVTNDQFIFTGDSLSQDVVVSQPESQPEAQ